jgi:predicted RNA-binding Zn-ribbon protein involved in translation (DUF1610 family)
MYCRKWMLPEEIRALARTCLSAQGEISIKKLAANDNTIEHYYGYSDEKTNQLASLGRAKLELTIAENLLRKYEKEILNYCPQCGRLATTPTAKQCRHCGHDWH